MKKHFTITFILLILGCLVSSTLPRLSYAQDGGLSGITVHEDAFTLEDDFDFYEDEPLLEDPFEGYNRWMFNINDKIYRKVLNPITKVYDFIIPKMAQKGLNNVARLATTPKRFFNNLLQKKPKLAFIEFERLLINSTLGIGGLFDPAKHFFKLKQHSEDFGQTLGYHGMEGGRYIVWPILGPSTPRDSIGVLVDNVFSPFLWFGIYDVSPEDGFKAFGYTKRVNNYTYNIKSTYNKVTEVAIDPYIALQNAYLQNREKNIKN